MFDKHPTWSCDVENGYAYGVITMMVMAIFFLIDMRSLK